MLHLSTDYFSVGENFKLAQLVWKNFTRDFSEFSLNYVAQWHFARHTVQYQTFSMLYVDSVLAFVGCSRLEIQRLFHPVLQLLFHFHSTIVLSTCFLTIQCRKSSLGYDSIDHYSTCGGYSYPCGAARLDMVLQLRQQPGKMPGNLSRATFVTAPVWLRTVCNGLLWTFNENSLEDITVINLWTRTCLEPELTGHSFQVHGQEPDMAGNIALCLFHDLICGPPL